MTPPISVLMPIFNASATLAECLDSLLRQTFSDFELVVVDDGCSDNSIELVRGRWPKTRLTLVAKGRVGLVVALNEGLGACAGSLIVRMDADDIAHPERLAKQWQSMQERNAPDLLGTQVAAFATDEAGVKTAAEQGYQRYINWQNSLVTHGDILRERFVECPIAHPTFCFAKETLFSLGGYDDGPWPEDHELVLRYAAHGLRLGKVPEVLVDWRDSQGRTSRQDPRYRDKAFTRLKVKYLVDGPLADLTHKKLWLCGGDGRARAMAQALRDAGVQVTGFVDVNPKASGQRLGLDVLPPQAICKAGPINPKESILLACVGGPQARDGIRALAANAGFEEGKNFWCVA